MCFFLEFGPPTVFVSHQVRLPRLHLPTHNITWRSVSSFAQTCSSTRTRTHHHSPPASRYARPSVIPPNASNPTTASSPSDHRKQHKSPPQDCRNACRRGRRRTYTSTPAYRCLLASFLPCSLQSALSRRTASASRLTTIHRLSGVTTPLPPLENVHNTMSTVDRRPWAPRIRPGVRRTDQCPFSQGASIRRPCARGQEAGAGQAEGESEERIGARTGVNLPMDLHREFCGRVLCERLNV